MLDKLKQAYRYTVDHLTKVLGALGAFLMFFDPETIHAAAQSYLGGNATQKMGGALFLLVIARGWYTGWKAKQPPQITVPPP